MTKKDLVDFLEPFMDETEILVAVPEFGDTAHDLVQATYRQNVHREGVIVLEPSNLMYHLWPLGKKTTTESKG